MGFAVRVTHRRSQLHLVRNDYVERVLREAGVTDPVGTITGVMPGAQAEIIVQAVNEGLQGVASDPIVFTMPAMASRKAETISAAASELPELAAMGASSGARS